jgi:hypothetical protein
MKKIINKTLAMLVICTALFSFTSKPGKSVPTAGGEGFEIYLNDKLLVQRFNSDVKNAYTMNLSSASATDQLIIKYHHCGKVGKSRVVTIKDDQNNVLKEFKYNDVNTAVSSISVPVKDLIHLKKGTTLKLYYSSTELPNGRMLASINTSRQTT